VFQRYIFKDTDIEILGKKILKVLEKVGVLCQNKEILKALENKGAKVDYLQETATFPPDMVEEFVKIFRKESKDQLVCASSTMVKIPPGLKTIKSREVNYSQNLLLFLLVKKANQFSKLILITTHSSQAQLLITKILVFALIVESSLVHPIEKILPRQKKHQGPTIT